MQNIVKSFNGQTLTGTSIRVGILSAPYASAQPVFIGQAQADSQYSGAYAVNERSIAVGIEILDYANRISVRSQIAQWFKRGTSGDLVMTFSAESADYFLPCVVVSFAQDPNYTNFFTVILQTGESAWRRVTETVEATWSPTGTGGVETITVLGTEETRLSLTLTNTIAPITGYLYQRLVRFVNVPSVDYGLRAWCMSLNTAALVTAGKMQADCDDLRIRINGKEVKRWISGANTTTTLIWFNADLKPGYSLALLTAVASSGAVTSLQFANTPDVKAAIEAMPTIGIVYHGTEWFAYKKAADDAANYRLTVRNRGTLGTAMQAHAAADVFKYIQNQVHILYGNSTATSPSATDAKYDRDKPVFKLASSDNTKWVFDSTSLFRSPSYYAASGQWQKFIITMNRILGAFMYNATGFAELGTVAPAMGERLECYLDEKWQSVSSLMRWFIHNPGGISVLSMTGRKYRNTIQWPTTTAMQRSANGIDWYDIVAEASPSAISTWETWSHLSQACAAGTIYVALTMDGTLTREANAGVNYEALTATVEFTSANIPDITVGSEAANVQMGVQIRNNENGDAINLETPMLVGKTLTFNGEDFEATYDGVNAHEAFSLDDDGRAVWIRLLPGDNDIEIVGTDIGTTNIVLSYYARRS